METAVQLREHEAVARKACDTLKSMRSDAISKARIAAEKAAQESFDSEHGLDMKARQDAYWKAKNLREEAEVAESRASSPWPEGTELVIWERPYDRWARKHGDWQEDHHVIVEIVTSDTRFRDNMADYSRPKNGAIIGRRIAKTGKIGVQHEELTDWQGNVKVTATLVGQRPSSK